MYAIGRKIYQYFYQEPPHMQRRTTGVMRSVTIMISLIAQERVFTVLALAMVVPFENRFGFVATCRLIHEGHAGSAIG
jgi:hypothetical protein